MVTAPEQEGPCKEVCLTRESTIPTAHLSNTDFWGMGMAVSTHMQLDMPSSGQPFQRSQVQYHSHILPCFLLPQCCNPDLRGLAHFYGSKCLC